MTKLYIGTASHDLQVHVAYHWSVVRLWATPPCELVAPSAETLYDGDLVRVRSRMVADFLESDATHLLFVDSDIDFTPECVAGMLAANADYVAAPYRRKRADKVELTLGIGMTMLSRAMLERMVERYRDELTFTDEARAGVNRHTVALFRLIHEGGNLLSEDFSFIHRWQAIGGAPMVYQGPGTPVGHWGSFRFGLTT